MIWIRFQARDAIFAATYWDLESVIESFVSGG